ncbi:MAG: TolC family protein [Paludisphaera borealis]|uniref:TolC family protein n=1 Tax=Paludisphaera borealis TaxID=1387353 RepID=UPI00284494AD|nr:TolC family protein [Paludisphaera borealis]MDR3620060.1 TolC family protein [Paludisphaera borealis]
MSQRIGIENRWRGRIGPAFLIGAVVVATSATAVRAQGPQVDVDNPPGVSIGRSRLGPALGAAGTSAIQDSSGLGDAPIGGRAGPSVSRAPMSGVNPQRRRAPGEGAPNFKVPSLPEATIPAYGELDLPEGGIQVGAKDGFTLDDTINILIQQNLGLLAMKFEIPMADADILTASLRANPIFYADSQLVPYGRYTRERPGGQTQYDVNITHPLDVNGKRKARTATAQVAKRAIEAQFQDAVRQQIDNLYTVFIDVAAAELTREFSLKYLEGITRLLRVNEDLLEKKQIPEDPVFALRAQLEQAQLQVRETTQAVNRTTRRLSQLLNIPREQATAIRIRDNLRDDRELPSTEDQLIATAMDSRSDLIATRLGLERAKSDVSLAKRERLSDLYLLYQPYTLQDNRPFGLKSPTSWALGLTAPLPIYNRNQGNIARAKINVNQTEVELTLLERQVQDEVSDAVHEFELSREAMLESEREILPASRRVRDAAYRRWQGGETNVLAYLDAQRDFNERVRDYRDSIVRHRRAVLDLNTAVGVRLLP